MDQRSVQRRPRRLTVEDAELVPVPAGAGGARVMGVLLLLVTLLGLGLLALGASLPSWLHGAVGLADTVTAEVTDREFLPETTSVVKYDTGNCAAYRFTLAWPDREGTFTACLGGEHGDLEVGDRIEVRAVPWTDEVIPTGDFDWAVVGLVVGGLLTWWGARGALRYFGVAGGRARGVRYTGVVDHVGQSTVTVRLDRLEGTRLRLLSSMRRSPFAVGERIDVWASGVTRWRRRPRGPWVVRPGGGDVGPVHAMTHAWVRR